MFRSIEDFKELYDKVVAHLKMQSNEASRTTLARIESGKGRYGKIMQLLKIFVSDSGKQLQGKALLLILAEKGEVTKPVFFTSMLEDVAVGDPKKSLSPSFEDAYSYLAEEELFDQNGNLIPEKLSQFRTEDQVTLKKIQAILNEMWSGISPAAAH